MKSVSMAAGRFLVSPLTAGFILIFLSACNKDNGTEPPPVVVGGISADNGLYYKAVMGTSTSTPPLEFTVRDSSGNTLAGRTVLFSRIVGDGTLLLDSVKTDTVGVATMEYSFSGLRGDAILMAKVRGIDSQQVEVRANTLIPGSGGQAQYILFTDKYLDVRTYNLTPASIDADPASWVVYANYEQALGVVFVLEDLKHDSTAVDTAGVLSVIVNTIYTGKTKDSIGVGSTLQAVRAVYGAPDTIKYDPPAPPIYIRYLSEGLIMYGDTKTLGGVSTPDTVIHEIHLSDFVPTPTPLKKMPFLQGKQPDAIWQHGYHRFEYPR